MRKLACKSLCKSIALRLPRPQGAADCLRFAHPAEANWRPEARKPEDLHLGGILGSLDWMLRSVFEDAWDVLGRL